MRRKSKVSYELKIEAVERYLTGMSSHAAIAKELSLTGTSVKQLVSTYKNIGAEALLTKSQHTSYSSKLKIAAVKDYLD